MSDYVLTCCSTADMPYKYFEKRNISLVCFHYTMNGEEYPDDLGQTLSSGYGLLTDTAADLRDNGATLEENICPLLNMSYDGKLIPRSKIHGKKRVIAKIVHMMEAHAQNGTDYSGKCFISNSACYDDARKVVDLIEEEFPHLNGPVMINSVGTVIGAHTGPGTVALFFFGDKRED